jgi:hypothetical protein
MMDILMKPHSYEAVEVANDRYPMKSGLLEKMQHLTSSASSSVRRKRKRQMKKKEKQCAAIKAHFRR